MADADLVITGTVLTVDDARPTAEALAVTDGRIVAVGNRSDVAALIGAGTQTIDVGDGCMMPGFIEAHGHPLMEALALSDRIVDIRPVTMRDADDVVEAVRREIAAAGSGRRLPERLGSAAAARAARADAGLARRDRAGRAAGDHPQLRTQGLFQLARRQARRPDPRHPRPQGRPIRPRRRRRTRRQRRGNRRGVPAAGRAPSGPATTRRCCAPSAPGSTAPG